MTFQEDYEICENILNNFADKLIAEDKILKRRMKFLEVAKAYLINGTLDHSMLCAGFAWLDHSDKDPEEIFRNIFHEILDKSSKL